MSITRFRPEVWSAQLLVALRKALVFAQANVVNRDYEGEITAAGDTVRITSISDPTIGTYVPNSTVITPEELTDAQRTLVIDQAKYFAFKVDDIDARQARGNVMPEAMNRAAYKLRDVVDQYIAGFESAGTREGADHRRLRHLGTGGEFAGHHLGDLDHPDRRLRQGAGPTQGGPRRGERAHRG